MSRVKVEIVKVVDESFPMFVECKLVDFKGQYHYFQDKLPIFSQDNAPVFPCLGEMRCTITQDKQETIIIDTSMPDDLESTEGKNIFEVERNQVI